jgi:hypothetical protein
MPDNQSRSPKQQTASQLITFFFTKVVLIFLILEACARKKTMPAKHAIVAVSLVFLGLAAPLVAAEDSDKREIVVTGKSLKDTEADLKNCIARACLPDEEIRAALAHAENQFIT